MIDHATVVPATLVDVGVPRMIPEMTVAVQKVDMPIECWTENKAI